MCKGENLFKQGFAQMVAKGDAKTGGMLVRSLDKLRRAVGIKNSPSTGDIAMLERLVMDAIGNRTDTRSGDGVQYAFIGELPDGTRVYDSDVDPNLTTDEKVELFKNRIATIFNLGAVELKTDVKKILVRGDKFTANKNVFGDKKANPDEMEAKYGMLYEMADILNTATYDPTATEMEPSYKNPTVSPKNKAHKDVKYWYKFRNDIVLDGVGYTVTFNIRDKGKSQYQYLIDVKENGYAVSHTALKGLRRAYRVSTNNRVTRSEPGVNTHSMQDGGGYTQNAYLPEDPFVDRMGVDG